MKIALVGYGKMGKAIEAIAVARGHKIVLKIDGSNTNMLTPENLQQADVAIEFSGPESAFENVKKCLELPMPVVCGSTGWLQNFEAAKTMANDHGGALLYASNFSVGVNIFFALNKKLAELMRGHAEYKASVEEIHHTAKKDAPSGTAISLAEDIIANASLTGWHLEPSAAPGSSLPITAKRIDPAPGTHIIKYASEIDDIEISHTAHSRAGFAHGAVLAAEFLQGRKGVFTMAEVLGLQNQQAS